MFESKELPPGPWRVGRDDRGNVCSVDDADGTPLLYPDETDYLGGSPEILRAVVSVPLLVAAARDALSQLLDIRASGAHVDCSLLETALDLVEGKGRAEA